MFSFNFLTVFNSATSTNKTTESICLQNETSSGLNETLSFFNKTLIDLIQDIFSTNISTGANVMCDKLIIINETNSTTTNTNVTFQQGPVIWGENQPPGTIATLIAKDYDGPENGAPFKFSISNSASSEIQSKFGVSGKLLKFQSLLR